MDYQLNFKEKIVLITGENDRLGRAIAEGFASLDATTVLVGRNIKKLEDTEKSILMAGGNCIKIQADLNISSQVDSMINIIKSKLGKADVLINNAGIGHRIPSVNVTEAQWDSVLDRNLKTPFILSTRIAKEFMIPQNEGSIVKTASMGGFSGIPASAAYSSSNGGIIQLSRSLAYVYIPKPIYFS